MRNIFSSTNTLTSFGISRCYGSRATKTVVSTSPHSSPMADVTRYRHTQRKFGIRRRRWLPPDHKAFLFTLVALAYLVTALIHFFRTGDGSMLTTLLEWVGAYTGVKTIANHVSPLIFHGSRRSTELQKVGEEDI